MRESLVACDTSVLVPALHPGYPSHEECRQHLARLSALPAHTLLESFRVLTTVNGPGQLAPGIAAQLLKSLALPHIQLPPEQYLPLLERMAKIGRTGGAIYDAQIAATAQHHGMLLLSRDRRAAPTYDAIGVEYELI